MQFPIWSALFMVLSALCEVGAIILTLKMSKLKKISQGRPAMNVPQGFKSRPSLNGHTPLTSLTVPYLTHKIMHLYYLSCAGSLPLLKSFWFFSLGTVTIGALVLSSLYVQLLGHRSVFLFSVHI